MTVSSMWVQITENIQQEKQGQQILTYNFSEPQANRLMCYLIKCKLFRGGCLMNNYNTPDVREGIEDSIVFWNS